MNGAAALVAGVTARLADVATVTAKSVARKRFTIFLGTGDPSAVGVVLRVEMAAGAGLAMAYASRGDRHRADTAVAQGLS
ncbi:hypothetical protein Aph01nite_41550 [Acrocarpospora phusangensis]|uniref:Uncharacterized protein n=1 Tax=Acrocarpospora phusangensis TaxID=1070424 RepID=A0A919QEE7_9ACTN|nr:hypothetical protein Aph01nite_41550 [Acrocarpospora phusangensis]